MEQYYYTVGSAEQAAFECEGCQDINEALNVLKIEYNDWKENDGDTENEPIITVFKNDEPERIIRFNDVNWEE